MKTNIFTRIGKSNYDSDFFGKGNTPNAKRKYRAMIKNKAKRQINKEVLAFD